MSRPTPLAGRTVLVLGAGDPTAQRLALHLAARGAAIVVAGPVLAPLLVAAGLVAATRAVARVVEAAAPPLVGASLLAAARDAVGPGTTVTDAVVAESAFASLDTAREAAAELTRELPSDARVVVVEARPVAGSKAAADRHAADWLR
jgi:hypothetical protein